MTTVNEDSRLLPLGDTTRLGDDPAAVVLRAMAALVAVGLPCPASVSGLVAPTEVMPVSVQCVGIDAAGVEQVNLWAPALGFRQGGYAQLVHGGSGPWRVFLVHGHLNGVPVRVWASDRRFQAIEFDGLSCVDDDDDNDLTCDSGDSSIRGAR